MSYWINWHQKSKYSLDLAKMLVTLFSMLSIHRMAARFPFLPLLASGPFFSSVAPHFYSLGCAAVKPRVMSESAAPFNVQYYTDQQQFTRWKKWRAKWRAHLVFPLPGGSLRSSSGPRCSVKQLEKANSLWESASIAVLAWGTMEALWGLVITSI